MLPKPHRLPPFLIREVLRQGKRVSAGGITLSSRVNTIGTSRLAIIVPTRLDKRSTVRNRTRRLLREAVRRVLPTISTTIDGVIIVHKKIVSLGETQKSIKGLVLSIKEEKL